MDSSTGAPGQLSKSARKRANQKARAAAEGGDDAPAAAPAAAGYPAGSQPKAKAKAEPKAQAEPKAKAAAKAEAKAQAEPKAKAKSQSKQQAKPQPAPAMTEEEIQRKKEDVHDFSAFDQFDDGTGDAWEVSTGKTKKQQQREDRQQELKKLEQMAAKQGSTGGKHIPGFTPIVDTGGKSIPGMAPQSVNAAPKVSQSVNAVPGVAAAPEKVEPKGDVASVSVNIKVPEERIGVVIGPKGRNIKLIQEKTGCTRIDTTGTEFNITGNAKSVAEAETAVRSLIEKGYTALAYDNFTETYVQVLDKKLPDIIGKKGAIIIKLKEALGCEVTIPKTVVPGKKCKVTIAGPTDQVEKAKECIESIVQWGHHDITHPGEVHEEIEFPAWAYAFVIGTKGSELRHIQNNYKVKVSIPREQDGNIVVVGLKEDVPRAVTYIWKLLDGAQNQAKGRNRTDVAATDDFGDEGPEEEWMSQYMYKRR